MFNRSTQYTCVSPKPQFPRMWKIAVDENLAVLWGFINHFYARPFFCHIHTQLPICLTGFYYTTLVQRKIKTYSKRRTQILRKLLSVRSRSSYLLHSCSTGTETSTHCRDPQQNWVTLIRDDLLQEHDWKSVFENRHLTICKAKHIRWLMSQVNCWNIFCAGSIALRSLLSRHWSQQYLLADQTLVPKRSGNCLQIKYKTLCTQVQILFQ